MTTNTTSTSNTKPANPFKSRTPPRQPKPQVVDPAQSLQQHGIHGSRQEQVTTPIPTTRRLAMVPLSSIRPGRYQKRETIDPEQYQQLQKQISELGLNFTAILCPDPDDPNFYNLMMGGHLRIQAATELGITEVSAVIREYNQVDLAKGTYFENNGRQPLTLIEEGKIFQQIQEDMGWSQEEIAKNLLVPGGRSHVALCLLAANAAPDIQNMLRKDPRRGQRCFYYLRQLDILGEERAMQLRAPIIEKFLLKKISTDEVDIQVKKLLRQEQGDDTTENETSLETIKRESKITSTVKSFRRFEKEIGTATPTAAEREALLKLKTKIESLLERS